MGDRVKMHAFPGALDGFLGQYIQKLRHTKKLDEKYYFIMEKFDF